MKVSHRVLNTGQHETIIELRWFAATGAYLVEAVGLGTSPEEAERSARLMLGQAKAELSVVTVENHRVPAASQTESAHERAVNGA